MHVPSLPEILMGILALLCLVLVLTGLRLALSRTGWALRRQKKTVTIAALIFALWVMVVGVLAQKGLLAQFDTVPPKPLLIVALPIAAAAIIVSTKRFKSLLLATPLHWLVLFQSFRIVVEILLWQTFEKGLIPVQMTFEGRNLDMIAGLLAVVVGIYMQQRPRHAFAAGIVFNIVGLGLLINIMAVAILSMPTPFRYFTVGPANTLVTTFPFVYLPSVLVVLAFGFHLFSLRQLWLHRQRQLHGKSMAHPAEAPAVLMTERT